MVSLIKRLIILAMLPLCQSLAQYRPGERRDEWTIRTTLAKELMNPLGIDSRQFLVAEEEQQLLGWAQIRPLGTGKSDPSKFNAAPGSYDAEQDANDVLWQEFEEDPTPFPNGWASLPWTKEYQAYQKLIKDGEDRREQILKNAALEEQISWELASVYVQKPHRNRGIGTDLVKRILQRHQNATIGESVYLLTLLTTANWYRDNFGFETIDDANQIPTQMAFEVAAGTAITGILGERLCCMRKTF
mmetsp:Transcript_17287/g.25544  ORF Transcript_17287/g.25544 Transcript_17287/m.25544 type:complete len:245 (-) Transcript_17287:213-947(-)